MMVIDLENGKIVLDAFGDADRLEDLEEEKHRLHNLLVIFLGSWFDDASIGVDWFTILQKGFSINEIKAELSRVILSLDFVDKIININLEDSVNRVAQLTFVVTTTSGNEIEFSEEI